MADRLLPWLRFFRIVNLPTVPGDVLAGALAMIAGLGAGSARPVFVAAAASCFAYLYGLADNDIVGAKTDVGRPIPNGEISLGAARVARALCWLAVPVLGLVGRLPSAWWAVMLSLFVAVSVYNRTKNAWLMGCCRGLNLLTGAAAVLGGVASVAPAKMIAPDIKNITGEKAAARFLQSIGYIGYRWPVSWSKPDGEQQFALFDENDARIRKIEKVELDRNNQFVEGSEALVKEFLY